MSFLVDTELLVVNGFSSATASYGAELLGVFRPLFITGFAIWTMLISYEVAFGKTEDGLTYILTKIFKIFLIGTVALWGWPEVASLLAAIKEGFVGGGSFSAQLEATLINPLALTADKLLVWFISSFDGLNFLTDALAILQNLFIFLVLIVVFGLAALIVSAIAVISLAMYLTASCIFILLMAIGPFFLLCLAFPFTQKFFEAFIGNVMTAVFGMAFVVLMMKAVTAIVDISSLPALMPDFSSAPEVLAKAKLIGIALASKAAICLLIIYMYKKIFDLAAALGGGLNMGGNMVGAMRTIARDLQSGGSGGGGNKRAPAPSNAISTDGAAPAPASSSASTIGSNRSFTGMGISAGAASARATGRGAVYAAKAVGSGVAATARFVNRGTLKMGPTKAEQRKK